MDKCHDCRQKFIQTLPHTMPPYWVLDKDGEMRIYCVTCVIRKGQWAIDQVEKENRRILNQ